MYPPGLIAHYVSRTPADEEIFHHYLDCFILVDARARSGAKAVAGILASLDAALVVVPGAHCKKPKLVADIIAARDMIGRV